MSTVIYDRALRVLGEETSSKTMTEFSSVAMPGVILDGRTRKVHRAVTFFGLTSSEWEVLSPGYLSLQQLPKFEICNPGCGRSCIVFHITECRREEQCLLKDANTAEK